MKFQFLLVSVLITTAVSIADTPFIANVSFGIFAYSFLLFIYELKNSIPIRELTLLVASIQLLVSSYIAFYIIEPNPIFLPKGEAIDYFKFAIPSILAFGLGLFTMDIKLQRIPNVEFSSYNLDIISKKIIYLGYAGIILMPISPGGLKYFALLITFFSYVGGIMCLYTSIPRKNKINRIIIAFIPVVSGALSSGVFFMAMIWIAYLAIYYIHFKGYSFKKNILIILLGIYFIFVVDSAKKDYRALTWSPIGQQMSTLKKGLSFGYFILTNATFGLVGDKGNLSARVTRANQGAIVTWVMAYTPQVEPFAEGKTIKDAVIASIFPRFLMQNKAKAGGRESFERFTGIKLNRNTSINISLLGEAWANFGFWGGILFMFSIGLFYSYTLKLLINIYKSNPIYFFFIPYIFLLTIKAEDDLLTPLNHMIKAAIVLYFINKFYLKKIIIKYKN